MISNKNEYKWKISISGLTEKECSAFFKDYPIPNSIVYKKGALMESCVELVSCLSEAVLANIIANILCNHSDEIWKRIKVSIQYLGESYFNISRKNLDKLYRTRFLHDTKDKPYIDIYEYVTDEYNKEFGTSIALESSLQLFVLPNISSDGSRLTIDRKLTIYIVLYVFGTPSLFQKYRLIYALLESHLYNEVNSLLLSFKLEYEKYKAQIEDLINKNPEWIVHLINFILKHELSHLYFLDDIDFKEKMIFAIKQRLQDFHFLDKEMPISNIYDIEKCNIVNNNAILEEYAADTLAFSQLASIVNQETTHNELAIICAICMTSVIFLEYASRIERLYTVSHIEDKKKRILNNIHRELSNSIRQELRVLLMDQNINNLLNEHSISDKAYALFNILVGTVYEKFNENLNEQLHLSLEPYYQALVNSEISLDNKNKHRMEKDISIFNQEIIELLNVALQKKNSVLYFDL